MNSPLVSVMIPCYNASKTLPLALASLLAQTYENWECIVVDDGSDDNPIDVINIINDKRIRFYRFEENRGRAVARQKALDMAQGEYLCMIDADDWIYPWKLERQVEIMEANPDLALVSAGMAIINQVDKSLVSVRNINSNNLAIFSPLLTVSLPIFAHAPCIFRINLIKTVTYDDTFLIAEDADFLLSLIMNHPYSITPNVLYVYSELESYSIDKMMKSIGANKKMFVKRRHQTDKSNFCRIYFKLTIKQILYRLSAFLGIDGLLIKRRSKKPTQEQMQEFSDAKITVYKKGVEIFKGTAYESIFVSMKDTG